MQESSPHSSWSTSDLVVCPAPLLVKGGRCGELVISSMPPVRPKMGEELVCGSTSVLTDRQNSLVGSVCSEEGEEQGERREGGGQQELHNEVIESSEPHLEVDSEEGPERGGARETELG